MQMLDLKTVLWITGASGVVMLFLMIDMARAQADEVGIPPDLEDMYAGRTIKKSIISLAYFILHMLAWGVPVLLAFAVFL